MLLSILAFLLLAVFNYSIAHHESIAKEELRNEEYSMLGRKIHDGKSNINLNNSFLFKVMTYNVLSQNQLELHPFLYKEHDPSALEWENRWPLIYNSIKHEDPEILCLQEVDQMYISSHFAKLFDLGTLSLKKSPKRDETSRNYVFSVISVLSSFETLSSGYSWVFKKKTGTKEDGVAVFYKSALFEDEDHSQVEFNQGVKMLNEDNVGVVSRLRLKRSPSHAIVVATTHLVYNPQRSNVRLAQIQVLQAEIDRLAFNKGSSTYHPVILTGDFNLQPHTGVYRLLTEGKLKYEDLSEETLEVSKDSSPMARELLPCYLGITDHSQHIDVITARTKGVDVSSTRLYHSEYNVEPHQDNDCVKDSSFGSGSLSHGFNYKSVYPHTQSGNKTEASTNHNHKWITVDYIFYSNPKMKDGQNEEESPLQLLSWLRLPTQYECAEFIQHLPNSELGSDHMYLVGKFLLQLHCKFFNLILFVVFILLHALLDSAGQWFIGKCACTRRQ